MAIDWNQLLLDATDETKASQIPVCEDLTAEVAFGSEHGPLQNGILKSPDLNFVDVAYPSAGGVPALSDSEVISQSVLVGLHLQIIEDAFGDNEINEAKFDDTQSVILDKQMSFREKGRPADDAPPGTLVYDNVLLLAPSDADFVIGDRLVPAATILGDRLSIPDGILVEGNSYTARTRAVLAFPFEEDDGINPRWFVFEESARPFYTRWGTSIVKVNEVPTVTNLRVNGQASPGTQPSSSRVVMGFKINNKDGPRGQYRIQVGGMFFGQFNASMWDSGWVDVGPGTLTLDVPFQGNTLSSGGGFAWRVKARDGLIEGPWSDLQSFTINNPPEITSLQVDGSEMLFGSNPRGKSSGAVVTWDFQDDDGDEQTKFRLFHRQEDEATETEISGTGTTSSVSMPNFDSGKNISIRLIVSDGIEETEVFGGFIADSPPRVTSLTTEGESNPTTLSTTTPTFEWVYQDFDASVQDSFRIQVASDPDFTTLLWDSGDVSGADNSVEYGSTASPLVAPTALTQGVFFVRVSVSDGTSDSGLTSSPLAFFAINERPGSPTIISPVSGTYDGAIEVSWTPASPVDADGDSVTYLIEITESRSAGIGWRRLVGPLPQSQTNYVIGANDLAAGDDYGVRVLASDGIALSDPSLDSTSQPFVIANHAPTSPVFTSPESGQTASQSFKAEWIEADPVDIDGDVVTYLLEMTSNASDSDPTWENAGIFGAGTKSAIVDVSEKVNGSDFQLRITAIDERGAEGEPNLSPKFSVDNNVTLGDAAEFEGHTFFGTSDGRLVRMREVLWQVDENWAGGEVDRFKLIATPGSVVKFENGEVIFLTPTDETAVLREEGN
jgi:hypothetical protein